MKQRVGTRVEDKLSKKILGTVCSEVFLIGCHRYQAVELDHPDTMKNTDFTISIIVVHISNLVKRKKME